jgi:hypothetical protein
LFGSLGANNGLILLINVSQGFGMFFAAIAPSGTLLQGNCAEWILEALETGPGNAPELANYATVKFINCAAVTVKAKTPYPNEGKPINMVASSGATISKGQIIGTREVDVSYV